MQEIDGDEAEHQWAWSISCRLAAMPQSVDLPEDLALLIAEAEELHPEMANGKRKDMNKTSQQPDQTAKDDLKFGLKRLAIGVTAGAAYAWGLWTFLPIGIGLVVAMLLMTIYGLETVLLLPTWAWSIGVIAGAIAVSLMGAMRPGPLKQEILGSMGRIAFMGVLMMLCAGALAAIMSQVPPGQFAPHSRPIAAELDSTVRSAGEVFALVVVWVSVVLMPVVMAMISVSGHLAQRNTRRLFG